MERIGLQMLGHLSRFTTSRITSAFWEKERQSMLAGRRVTRNDVLHPPINALSVLKTGMGKQAAELMKGSFKPQEFDDYMEIYDRRYKDAIQKHAKVPLKGTSTAVSNVATVGFSDRLQAGALLSRYPYKQHVALNDADCQDPLLQPEKTHKPIGDDVPDSSVDLIACVGGLHHLPADRVDAFAESMARKLRPGAVILMRDHDVRNHEGRITRNELSALVSVVHTFVNAADGVSWEAESKEIRDYRSAEEWTKFMRGHGFTRIAPSKALVLKDDPTENAMMAFVKTPQNLQEMREAISYRSDCTRPKVGTRATWIEWGNVRFSKDYAAFLQGNHEHAFDPRINSLSYIECGALAPFS